MNLRRWIYNICVIATLLSPCVNIVLAKDTPIHGPFFDCKTKVLHKSSRRYIPGWKDLTQAQAEYIETQILPVLGARTLFKDKDTLRTCTSLNDCTVLDDFNSKRLRIEWDDSLDEPQIRSTPYDRILRTNTRIRLSDYPHRGSDWIYHWVMGHPLHPFTAGDDAKAARLALGEPELVYKQVQRDAIAVIDSAIRRKVKKLSWVAPTGVGKTEPLKYLLKKQLRTHGNKIHVVLADQDFLVRQLAKDIQDLRNAPDLKKHAFQLVKWGGKNKAYPLSALFKQHDDSKMPLVLVTTIQSLMGQIAESPSTHFRLLRKHMRTLVIDESHHSGANRAKLLIDEVVDHPDANTVLFGPTATPLHETTDFKSLYDNNLFHAYLDDTKTFWTKHREQREVKDVVTQLTTAIDLGELTPIKRTWFLSEEPILGKAAVQKNQGLFLKVKALEETDSERFILNPSHLPKIVAKLGPLLERHQQGFITLGTIDEAKEALKQFRRLKLKTKKTYAVMHSDLGKSEIEHIQQQFKDGEINFIITVKQLDEGVNFPRMSLYIDLNRETGPRQFLQRLGRILRLSPGKEHVEMATLFRISEDTVAESLEAIRGLVSHRARPRSDWELEEIFKRNKRYRRSNRAGKRFQDGASSSTAPEPTLEDIEYQELTQQVLDNLNAFVMQEDRRGPKAVAKRLKDFVEKNFRLPTPNGGTVDERKLYNSAHNYFKKQTEAFLGNLDEGTRMAASEWGLSAAARAARVTQETFDSLGALPKPGDPLYFKIISYRDNPEFRSAVSPETLQAIDSLGRKASGKFRGPTGAALRLKDFVRVTGRLPSQRNSDEIGLYATIQKYKNDPEFKSNLTKPIRRLLYPNE